MGVRLERFDGLRWIGIRDGAQMDSRQSSEMEHRQSRMEHRQGRWGARHGVRDAAATEERERLPCSLKRQACLKILREGMAEALGSANGLHSKDGDVWEGERAEMRAEESTTSNSAIMVSTSRVRFTAAAVSSSLRTSTVSKP